MPENQIPSVNPADLDSLAGAFSFIVRKILQQTDKSLPATIIAYDRATNMATVQPMIKIVTTGDTVVSRAPLASVPVVALGGGGFFINFPLVPGDTGWIDASDRDISLYLQSAYKESPPNTGRIHSFSDARFLPDVMANYTIAAEDEANMVIQNADGTVKIALWPTKVKVAAPNIETVGILTHTGALNVTGAVAITGALAVSGALTNAGVSVGSTHKHSGVTPGPGNTGNPI